MINVKIYFFCLFKISKTAQGRTNGGGARGARPPVPENLCLYMNIIILEKTPKSINKWLWFQKMSFFTRYITLISSNDSENIILAHFKQIHFFSDYAFLDDLLF